MSYLRDIFTGLETMAVSFTKESGAASGTINCLDLDEIKVVQRADLPCRLLLPMEAWGGEGNSITEMSVGVSDVSAFMTWYVTDLMLWAVAGGGTGPKDWLPDLVRYAGAYMEIILDNVDITTNCLVQRAAPKICVVEWPEASRQFFYAVQVSLEIQELMNP